MPAEHAGKIARKVTEVLGSPADAPFAVDADVKKFAALKGRGEGGLLAIPDRKLTAETVAGVGKGRAALGHLWMRNVLPAVSNAAPDASKLRTLTMHGGDKDAKVEVNFLGISKADGGNVEHGLYAKDQEALERFKFFWSRVCENAG